MNLKPINEVPEVETLQEGDKILINSNGAAKQIAANKLGGGGGMGTIYGELSPTDDGVLFVAHADKELTVPMTYAEGKAMIEHGGVRICLDGSVMGMEDTWMYIVPAMIAPNDVQCLALGSIALGTEASELWIIFSDTPGISSEEG